MNLALTLSILVLVTPILADDFEPIMDCAGEETDSYIAGQARASKEIFHNLDRVKIPKKFDARKKWPFCQSLKTVLYQGHCGGCWAFAATTVMSDRLCIATGGTFNQLLSTQDLLECCNDCVMTKGGCRGGDTWKGFAFWEKTGVVSKACKPLYQGTTKGHSIKNCRKFCTKDNDTIYRLDKKYAISTVHLQPVRDSDLKQVQAEIMLNGPLAATMKIYKYVKSARSNAILKYDKDKATGKPINHAIKIIGWDVVNKVPVWIMANSWGPKWCTKGFCYIRRGHNDFGLERTGFKGGIAKVKGKVQARMAVPKNSSRPTNLHWLEHLLILTLLYLHYFF